MPAELTLHRLAGFKRGETLRFTSSPVTLGTDASSHVGFDATWDRSVSAKHAALEWRDDSWWIRDTSKDGLYLKGRRLPSEEKLSPGTELELGRGGPRLRFDYVPEPAKAANPVPVPGPPADSIVTRHTPSHAPASSPAPALPFGRATPLPRSSAPWLGIAIAALIVLGFITWFTLGRSADEGLAAAAQKYEKAVGLVIVVGSADGGPVQPYPVATAWAIGPRTFATNSHVTEGVLAYMKKDLPVYVTINRHSDLRYRVIRAVSHPRYNQVEPNFDGRAPAASAYDVGILEVEETLLVWLPVAPASELRKMDSGYRIAYLGFPSEGMAGGGVDPRSPVATMQSGIITSVTDWWLSKATFEKSTLIQHNLGTTGGSSGSPIFNARGAVVGILNAGNMASQIVSQDSAGKVDIARTPSAVMVNFAQRVDLLRDIYTAYPKD